MRAIGGSVTFGLSAGIAGRLACTLTPAEPHTSIFTFRLGLFELDNSRKNERGMAPAGIADKT